MQILGSFGYSKRGFKVLAMSSVASDASNYLPMAPILLPDGPWDQVLALTI